MTRCGKHDKALPTPPSFPLDRAAAHPTYKHRLTPGAQCEREAGHEGPHRNGCLVWHDPPRSSWKNRNTASWSSKALERYQRARSSNVKVTRPDGSSYTLSKWSKPRRRRRPMPG